MICWIWHMFNIWRFNIFIWFVNWGCLVLLLCDQCLLIHWMIDMKQVFTAGPYIDPTANILRFFSHHHFITSSSLSFCKVYSVLWQHVAHLLILWIVLVIILHLKVWPQKQQCWRYKAISLLKVCLGHKELPCWWAQAGVASFSHLRYWRCRAKGRKMCH